MSQLAATTFDEAKKYLTLDQASLVVDVETVLNNLNGHQIGDYSFVVAPIAKAYEGYLKDFFLKLNIIDKHAYTSDRFRVGKTLNPSLRFKRFSIFQKLADLHEDGGQLAEILWDAWKHGRNEIFHYFPNNVHRIDRSEAESRINLILKAIIDSAKFALFSSFRPIAAINPIGLPVESFRVAPI